MRGSILFRSPMSPTQSSDASPPPAAADRRFVLVSPTRDEAKTIGITIASVVGQTCRPVEWVIVDDGSTDGTSEIIAAAAAEHPWIRPLTLPPREGRSFARVVENTTKGIEALQQTEYAYLGLLDTDVRFESDYFERLIAEFERDPRLGLAGGVAIDIGEPRDRLPRNRIDVPGALQFYSRRCFERLGGLLPIPEGGWDGMACAMARMRGFTTRLCTDLIVDHLKPRNIAHGGALRRKWQMGVRDHAVGYHPVFEAIKCASRLHHAPVLLGATAWFVGYVSAALARRPRTVPPELVRFIRHEQLSRILPWTRKSTTINVQQTP